MALRPFLDRVAERQVTRKMILVEGYVRVFAAVDTSELVNSVGRRLEGSGINCRGIVGAGAAHARWVEEGTGIYGPRGRPIVPVRSPVLVFSVGGRVVRARSVKGQPAQPYLKPALHAAF